MRSPLPKQATASLLPPVVTLDGPSGVGKGTIARMLAKKLGWHYLDSGAIYRAAAWWVSKAGIDFANLSALLARLNEFNLDCLADSATQSVQIYCCGEDITKAVRTPQCGQLASKLSVIPQVRQLLLACQRAKRKPPGLVTDGRDMGTVIFPDAIAKFYLQAALNVRATRRYNQLKQTAINVSLHSIVAEMSERDERDQQRAVAPAVPAEDVVMLDTTDLSVDEVLAKVLAVVKARLASHAKGST